MHLLMRFLVLALVGFANPAMAKPTDKFSDSEIKAMPPYCAARLYRDPANVEYWKGALGPMYIHMHHFCHGIGFINRYYTARTPQEKSFNLNSALGQINYVAARARSDFSLLPEIYLSRGLVYSLMKKDGAAIADIRKAIELDPKPPRAYQMAAEHYAKLNQKEEALKLATEGLRHNPDSTILQRLYAKHGGQLPYPDPIAKQELTPDATTNDAGQNSGVAQQAEQINHVPATSAVEAGGKESVSTPVEASELPKIGSPSNPWCRFCPPEPNQ